MPRKTFPYLKKKAHWIKGMKKSEKKALLSGKRILPRGITGRESLATILEESLLAYNGRKLGEACRLFANRMLGDDVTVVMSLTGALTPAGLGCSSIIPLIRAGFVDWIVSTGANLYHDLHFAFNCPLHSGHHETDDDRLHKNDVVRIYDVFLGYTDCLLKTDRILQNIVDSPEFQKEMSTTEFHWLLGKYAAEWERKTGLRNVSVLAAAHRADVPVFTSAPGDSTIGMNIAMLEIVGHKLRFNPSLDVNESTSIVLDAKRHGRTGVVVVGGGSPKNFVLQTEPHIQEILGIEEVGHDYYIQFTDARPDTGGLSGATPSEAVSWGKINPDKLPDAVVAYLDATVALPLLTHYALARAKKRPLKRLYRRRAEMLAYLESEFRKALGEE